jgi:hypothetical protein
MDENQISEFLYTLREAIIQVNGHLTQVEKKLDESIASTDEKINALKTTVYDEIITPANEYISGQEKEARFDDFNEKYGDKLRPFNDDLSTLEGSDYDLVRDAFDRYDSFEGDKMGEDEFVEALIGQLGDKLSEIKHKLGVPEDTDIAVQETGDGEVEVVTEDGEVVASSDEGSEEPGEEETTVEVTDLPEDEDKDDDPDEVAAFEKELESYK